MNYADCLTPAQTWRKSRRARLLAWGPTIVVGTIIMAAVLFCRWVWRLGRREERG